MKYKKDDLWSCREAEQPIKYIMLFLIAIVSHSSEWMCCSQGRPRCKVLSHFRHFHWYLHSSAVAKVLLAFMEIVCLNAQCTSSAAHSFGPGYNNFNNTVFMLKLYPYCILFCIPFLFSYLNQLALLLLHQKCPVGRYLCSIFLKSWL